MAAAAVAATLSSCLTTAVTSRQMFEEERNYAEYLHEQEILLEERQHVAETQQVQELHRKRLHYKTELFAQDMMIDVSLAARDATRDAIHQCSLSAYSFVLGDVLLLNCAFLILSQWNIPTSTNDTTSYSIVVHVLCIFLAFAFIALLASTIFSLRLQKVATSYDIGRPLRRYLPCGRVHTHFNEYLACHCEALERWCRRLFIAGALSTTITAVCWAYLNYVAAFQSMGMFVVFLVPCIVACVVVLIGDLVVKDRTRPGKRDLVGISVSTTMNDVLARLPFASMNDQ